MKTSNRFSNISLVLFALLLMAAAPQPAPYLQTPDPSPPEEVVKLVFIHHSTGENWLTDGYGNLGRTLDQNNYFVSDTNYGWGPDAVGDRTDIPNWTEWFAGENTDTHMMALFNENEQHSSYTRMLTDPGGENQIIMFKSCFPNSALEGSPDDLPGEYEELSVRGAKYVYNTILRYFATRPDKLFVVITAPPLSDPTYAGNARAFNQWLVNDWLRENNYTLNNVAVFDFYNILTGLDAHHRINNGQVEHILGSQNTLYYPSGDDHPSEQGSRKATDEFVPMLNVFYHRWKAGAPLQSASEPVSTISSPQETESESESELPAAHPASSGVIDDFESGTLPETFGWEAFHDDATSSSMSCGIESGDGHSGNASLKLDFDIAANSWGTCALFYESPWDWSAGEGLVFYFRAVQAGALFNIDLYAGSRENRETYLYTVETPPESVSNWIPMELRWEDFHRADWEENAGDSFAKADQVSGMAFGFNTLPDAPSTGTIWVDDLQLMRMQAETQPATESQQQTDETESGRRPLFPCAGAIALPLGLIGMIVLNRRKRQTN